MREEALWLDTKRKLDKLEEVKRRTYAGLLLIYFNGGVDLLHKPETSKKSNGARQHEKGKGNHAHVAEIQHCRYKTRDVKFGEEIPDRVEEQVAAWGSCWEVRTPPPSIIFVAELEVAHHNGDFRTCDNKDGQHNEQKSKNKVQLMQPHSWHNEK